MRRPVYYSVLAVGPPATATLDAMLEGGEESTLAKVVKQGVDAGLPVVVVVNKSDRGVLSSRLRGHGLVEITSGGGGFDQVVKDVVRSMYDQADALILTPGDLIDPVENLVRELSNIYYETMPYAITVLYMGSTGYPLLLDWRLYDDVLKSDSVEEAVRNKKNYVMEVRLGSRPPRRLLDEGL